jgi:ribonuclease D
MPDKDWKTRVRDFGAARKYGAPALERWLRLSSADGEALLALAQELRLGENQLRDLWDWAEEVAERDGTALRQVLACESIASVRRSSVGRSDKLKRLKAALRRLRLPGLTEVEDRISALVQELHLPANAVCRLPEFLEGDEVRIEITARNPAELRAAAARLQAAAATQACARIFELLAEAP